MHINFIFPLNPNSIKIKNHLLFIIDQIDFHLVRLNRSMCCCHCTVVFREKKGLLRMMTVANFTLALEMECKSKAKVINISDLISVLNIDTCDCLLLKGAFTFAKIKEFIWSLRNVH